MSDEYATTMGEVRWDDRALELNGFDDPIPPKGVGWELVGSAMTELRVSRQYILWFWHRSISIDTETLRTAHHRKRKE